MNDVMLFKCNKCGKIIELYTKMCCPTICCGEPMVQLKANSTDAALEKHVPVVTIREESVHVEIGSVLHPMLEEHHIQFVILVTDKGYKRVDLHANEKPIVDFAIAKDEKPLKVYEYCNLHGLWVKEL
ncbi:MAG: desulfoferrodoxin family protein [Bacilli bacterium]